MRASYHRLPNSFIALAAVWLAPMHASIAADLVTVEAESATLGTNFTTGNASGVSFITCTNNNTSLTVPALPGRVASYSVTFPAAGTYDLYARLRVGVGMANDDSLFYANGFGVKSATTGADWILCNNLANVGFVNAGDTVTGAGTAASGVWKWINISQFNGGAAPINFTVTAGNQTFQIGGREDGLDFDKLAFGTTGTSFAVSNLDSGTVPATSPPLTNVFVGPEGIALHRFSPLNHGLNADGANPAAGLAWVNGVLCGTTLNGGANGAGTAFYLSANGANFVAFRAFTNAPDAGSPAGELSVAGIGFFSSSFGGGSGGGAVFVGQTNGGVAVIRSFSTVSADNATNYGGASPTALLAMSGGTLYGTTTAGGAAASGTIFTLTTNGAIFSVLHNFSVLNSQTGTNPDGAVPWGGLILSGDKLYGTASAGGTGGSGVVFSIGTNGGGFTTLHSFAPRDTLTGTNADGAIPFGGLVLANGTLYGTTFAGGSGGSGTIFSLSTDGSGFTLLHHFTATDAVTRTNTDGASPSAGLILSSNVLFGTASAGGAGAAGAVFLLNLASTQFTTLHSFAALASNGTNTHGALPVAPVMRLGNSLYGTTFSGGPGAAGTVFSIPLPAPPAIITNIVRNPNGSVTLFFLGTPNTTNIIQAALSLRTPVPWQNIFTNVADAGGVWQFTDSAPTTNRFYRSYAY